MLIEFCREIAERRRIVGMSPRLRPAVLVHAPPELTQPLASLKNFTLPVVLTCSPAMDVMRAYPRRIECGNGGRGGDVYVRKVQRAQFCKARLHARKCAEKNTASNAASATRHRKCD